MIIAAVVVGALTAYFYGLRPGAYAAAATFVAFLLAAMVPGFAVYSYLAVGTGVAGVAWLGPRRADPTHAARAGRMVKRGVTMVRAWVKR